MRLPQYLTTVTPFSKLLAMVLFILFPIGGFYLGIKYQQSFPAKIEYITQEKIVKVIHTETQADLVNRCGDYPLNVLKATPCGKFNSCGGPSWSPDCRYIAWSLNTSVPGGWIATTEAEERSLQELPSFDNLQTQSDEGVFVYEDKTGLIKTIYHPPTKKDARSFTQWKGSNIIVFVSDSETFFYDLSTGKITSQVNQK